jgi:hypothetical protein
MVMAWEIDISMKAVLIGKLEEFTTAHGDHLLGSSKPAIVSHDPTNQTCPQKHVSSFN